MSIRLIRGDWWLYVTSGCWEVTRHDGHGSEFFLAAPGDDWAKALETLFDEHAIDPVDPVDPQTASVVQPT
ncbi:hypothetical protein HUT11_07335 [Streptomyces seoulensis]|nr:hypothetical protein HUT11_07335 [Streptomyces seoulensis]